MSEGPSRIIVDDDWKAKVEQEKAAAKGGEATIDSAATTPEPATSVSTEQVSAADQADMLQPPPDASFSTLVTLLFSQGMAALGQLPGPGGKSIINKPLAKHFIDTIEMLGEKTKGNLTDEESKMTSEILHALRMTFVSVKAAK